VRIHSCLQTPHDLHYGRTRLREKRTINISIAERTQHNARMSTRGPTWAQNLRRICSDRSKFQPSSQVCSSKFAMSRGDFPGGRQEHPVPCPTERVGRRPETPQCGFTIFELKFLEHEISYQLTVGKQLSHGWLECLWVAQYLGWAAAKVFC